MKSISRDQAIFIHSLWRAGSTYVFKAFRRSKAGYWVYQEPVHEIALAAKDNPEILTSFTSEALSSLRHPQLEKPYFYELQQTHQAWHDIIEKRIVYDDYFDVSSVEPLKRYLQALITSANGRAVIQECHTSSRIGAIKRSLGGLHLYLWRNPWDQWWSFKVTDHFDAACQVILGAHSAPQIIARLKEEIGYIEFHNDNIPEELNHFALKRLTSENSYLVFYTLWCLGLLEGMAHADRMINIDSLSTSDKYRRDVASNFKMLGISGVDFSDCHVPQAFFDTKDKEFFARIESRVHGLFLASGYSQETINSIHQARNEHAPSINEGHATLLRDLHRAREVALRFETAEAVRGQYFHHVINKLEDQAKALEGDLNASKSHVKDIEIQIQNSQAEARKANELLAIEKQERHHFELAQKQREKEYVDQISSHRHELENLLRNMAQREQEIAAQILAIQQHAAHELSEQARTYTEHERALQRHHVEREQALIQQVQAAQQEQRRFEQERMRHEKEYVEQISRHRHELESLLRDMAQREQEIAAQILAIQQHAAHELSEQARTYTEHERALQQQSQALQAELATMRNGLAWRLTAPLRAIAFRLSANRVLPGHAGSAAEFSIIAPLPYSVLDSGMTGTQEFANNRNFMETTSMISDHSIKAAYPTQLSAVSNLKTLMQYQDRQFVECAYLTLLKRRPDHEGFNYYLDRLRAGFPKIQILAQLCLSPESKAHAVNLPGLGAAIQRYRRGQYPLVGWLFRLIEDTEGNRQAERKLRAIEQQISLFSDESCRRLSQLETMLTSNYKTAQQMQSAITDHGNMHQANTTATSTVEPINPDGVEQLSLHARDIYFQLKSATARHSRG